MLDLPLFSERPLRSFQLNFCPVISIYSMFVAGMSEKPALAEEVGACWRGTGRALCTVVHGNSLVRDSGQHCLVLRTGKYAVSGS